MSTRDDIYQEEYTNLDLAFIHVDRKVGYNDFFCSLSRRGSGFAESRYAGGVPGTSGGGGFLFSKDWRAYTATTGSLSIVFWARGDDLW